MHDLKFFLGFCNLAHCGEKAKQAEGGGDGADKWSTVDEIEIGDDGKHDEYGGSNAETKP